MSRGVSSCLLQPRGWWALNLGETEWWLSPGSFWPCLLATGLGLLGTKAFLFPGLDKVNLAMTLVHLSLTLQALEVLEEFCSL